MNWGTGTPNTPDLTFHMTTAQPWYPSDANMIQEGLNDIGMSLWVIIAILMVALCRWWKR